MKLSEILTGPDKWCQNAQAINRFGAECAESEGVKWCLLGAVRVAYRDPTEAAWAREKLRASLPDEYGESLMLFSDDKRRKFSEVAELIRRAGV